MEVLIRDQGGSLLMTFMTSEVIWSKSMALNTLVHVLRNDVTLSCYMANLFFLLAGGCQGIGPRHVFDFRSGCGRMSMRLVSKHP